MQTKITLKKYLKALKINLNNIVFNIFISLILIGMIFQFIYDIENAYITLGTILVIAITILLGSLITAKELNDE